MTTTQKKVRAIFFSILMIVSMVGGSVAFEGLTAAANSGVEPAGNTAETELVVDNSNSDSYDSIQNAVDDASDGDTIEVRPGTYTESVVINKNITLTAPDGATIKNDSISSRAGIQVFGTTTPTISGFTLTGWQWGFSAGGSRGAWTLRDTVITDAEVGIGAAGTPAPWTVANVTVANATSGLSAYQSSGDWVVRDSAFQDSGGVSAEESSGGWIIERTTIQNSTDEAIKTVDSSGQWRVNDVTLTDNADGIETDGSTDSWIIQNSVIENTTDDGVSAERTGGDWIIEGVSIRDAGDQGIEADDSDGKWTVRDTAISYTGDDGVHAENTSGNWTLDLVSIENTGDDAVDASGATNNWTIHESILENATGSGVAAYGAVRGNATRNYWGAPDGPSGEFNGSGTAAIGNVSISPFYTDSVRTTLSEEPSAERTPQSSTAQPAQCDELAPFMYDGQQLPTFCSVLGGTAEDGNLRVLVADGLLGTQRYANGGWQNQFYTYSGAVIVADGEKTSLGYYNNQPDPTGNWGSIQQYQQPDSQSLSDDGNTVTTVWRVDGLRIEQEVTLPAANSQFYRLDWEVTNEGNSSVNNVHFLRGEDTYLAGGDFGNGFWNAETNTVGVRKSVDDVQQRLSYQGITEPVGYRSAFYSTVINDVESGSLENSVTSEFHDNGYALEWQRETLTPGDSWDIRSVEGFVRSSLSVTGGQTRTLEADTETFSFNVSNVGQTTRTLDLSTNCPEGITCSAPDSETLDAGASSQVEVTAEVPEGYEPGTYEIVLTANAEGVRPAQGVGQLEIQGPNFQVTDVAAPDSVGTDSPLTYTARITNTGGENATQSIEAAFAGETVTSRTITLNANETRTLAFTTKTDAPGSFDATVSTQNDSREQIVEVVGQEFISAQSTGDPHITTFDGLSYEFMAAGDYVVAREPQGDLLVVARQVPVGDSVSNNNATATRVGDSRVVITADATSPVSIDGESVQIDNGERVMIDDGAGMVTRQGSTITVYYAGDDGEVTTSDEHLTANIIGDRVDISLSLHPNREAAVEGVFGNIDGEPGNDITFDNGTVVEQPLNSDVLYSSLRDDWRATGQENLFASSYYVEDFPRSIVTVDDLSESERNQAAGLLEDTSLAPGTPQYRDALLDVALTGDTSYIASARRVDRQNVTEPTETESGFSIDSIRGPLTISQGDGFSTSATLTNPSENVTTETVEFVVDTDGDGALETFATRDVTLSAGEKTNIGFVGPSTTQAETTSYGVRTANDRRIKEVDVIAEQFKTAVSTGDPHIVTFDDVAYDYMAAGEYTLVREPTGSLEIQARQEPVAQSDSVTINTALATTLDGRSVVIDATDSTPVQVDGTPTPIEDGTTVAVGNGAIKRTGDSYVIVYPGENGEPDPTDERVIVDMFDNRIDIEVRLDPDRSAPVEGVLGNADGNSSNDITFANGTVVSNPSDPNALYGPFREDWRVTENTTLFEYEGDNGPETYYDPAIPRGSFTVNDIDPDTRAEAEELAAEAGLTPDTSAYRNALIDYALTGDESYFSSAQQQNASTDVNETVTLDRPPELNGSNTLSVTATNASGDIVPGAEIKLYNDSFVILDSRQADQSGIASWSTLTAGEYNVELYGPEGAFWGATTVTVDADGASTTVRRTAPRLSGIELTGDRTEEVQVGVGDLTVSYYGGRPITISPKIRNDGPERSVRVRIQVDVDNDDSAEKEDILRGGFGTNILAGETGSYGYEFDPSTNGTKQVQVVTETYINGKWAVTDLSSWTERFEVKHNIVGYDLRDGDYDNRTTSATSESFQSQSASLPSDLSLSAYSPPALPTSNERRVTATDEYPWNAVGQLAVNISINNDFLPLGSCSATVIEDRHIITAGHCVYDSENDAWITEEQVGDQQTDQLYYLSGRNGEQYPAVLNVTRLNVTYVHTYDRWVDDGDGRYDIAVLTLNESIENRTGSFGYEAYPHTRQDIYGSSFNPAKKASSHTTGYPGGGAYVQTPNTMHDYESSGEGTQVSIPRGSDCRDSNLCHDIATGRPDQELLQGGVSGGPIWQSRGVGYPEIISVASQGPNVKPRWVNVPIIDETIDIGQLQEDVIRPFSDAIGVRVSEKKEGDIGQMIGYGYSQIREDNPDQTLSVPTQPEGGKSGAATGDPHLTTYDGVAYDFQAAGEFVLTNDSDGNPYVQARLRPIADRDVSVISAVATELNGTSVTIDARDDQMLTVDGTAQSLSTGESMTVGDGEIFRTSETYIVVYSGEDGEVDDGDSRLEATVADDRLDVVVKPNRTAVDSMTGLLGSPDGNPDNDLMRADGTALSTQPSFEELYGQYREGYRVTAENSLFDYEDGESAAGFYDPNYPSGRVTVDDLPADDREAAIEATTNAGLEPGTAHFRDAVIDYALTEDLSYVESATRAADETEVTTDVTPTETTLTAPELTVETDSEQVVTEDQPVNVAVAATHPDPDNVRVIVANGTETVFEENISDAFDSEQTVSWDTTTDGETVEDGAYTLGVIATSETGVRNVTTRGLLVDNTAPSVTLETTETDLNASVNNTTVRFGYTDSVSGVNPESVTVLENGTNVTETAVINSTAASYELTGLEPESTRTIEIRVSNEAGLTANQSVTISVAAADGDSSDDDSGDETSDDGDESDGGGADTTPSSGGGGGGGDIPSSVSEPVPDDVTTLAQTDVDIEIQGEGSVADPSDDTDVPVETITFDAVLFGDLEVREYNTTPSEVAEPPVEPDSIVEIAVPPEYDDESAEVRFAVDDIADSTGEVDTENLTVWQHTDGEWSSLDSEVRERPDGSLIVQAETPALSMFVISADGTPSTTDESTESDDVSESTDESTTEGVDEETDSDTESTSNDGTDDPTPNEPFGTPNLRTLGIIISLLALIMAVLFARRLK